MFLRPHVAIRAVASVCLAALSSAGFAQQQVTTYHNDNLRTGLNSNERILTPATVSSSKFGLLFDLPVDGQVYAQPLYLPRVYVAGKGVHNVLYVATEHNSVYAFDADSNTGSNAKPLWHVNFGASVPSGGQDIGSWDINPEVGITGTPVIHTTRSGQTLLYVVSKTKSLDSQQNPIYTQKLHAISVASGVEQLGGPIVISGSVPGNGDASVGGTVTFDPFLHHNRPGLLIVPSTNSDSTLYVGFASHGDYGPYHGWLFAYDADKLKPVGLMNTTANGLTDPSGYPIAAGGIWQSGGALASDGTSIYFATGNGTFDPATGSYGDAIVRIKNKTNTVADFFAPAEQLYLDDTDNDLGSGAVMLLPAAAGGTSKLNLLVQAGKGGSLYLLNTANLGGYNATDNVHQELPGVMPGIWGAPAYFNKNIYYGPQASNLLAFQIKNGKFVSTGPVNQSKTWFNYPGPTPSVSSNGLSDGIVWAIQADAYGNGPAVLHAYDATNLSDEFYNSGNTSGRDTLDTAVKFTTPTITNGKVYVGCNSSVGVFGIGTWAATPTIAPASGLYANSVTVKLADSTPASKIHYTTDGTVPTESSPTYTKPLTFTSSVTVSARAFVNNGSPSLTATANYLINGVIGNGTGLFGAYYDGLQDPAGTPTATELDPQIDFTWNGYSPIAGVAGSNWAGQWTGQIQAMTTGTYTLKTLSDDGVRVFIDGNMIIDDYTNHAPTYDYGTYNFVAGQKYNITIKYFQGSGGSVLQLFWAAPGIPYQLVPTSQLYPGS